jgi:type III secretion protein J
MLVANGVAGLSYDKVSVILVPVESHAAAARADERETALSLRADPPDWTFYGLSGLAAALAATLGFVLLRQRQRVYPLRPAELMKSP